jgi:hypothetical protein
MSLAALSEKGSLSWCFTAKPIVPLNENAATTRSNSGCGASDSKSACGRLWKNMNAKPEPTGRIRQDWRAVGLEAHRQYAFAIQFATTTKQPFINKDSILAAPAKERFSFTAK